MPTRHCGSCVTGSSKARIREKRAYFLAHPMIPHDVLANGIRRMQAEAKQTMELVREKTGLSYSLDLFADELDIFGNED